MLPRLTRSAMRRSKEFGAQRYTADIVISRRFHLMTVLVAVFALLLSQAALAGYACQTAEKAQEIARMVEAQMPCAQEMARDMDYVQPGLCHAHCQAEEQSAGSFHPPVFADLMQLGAVLTVHLAHPPEVAFAGMPSPLLRRDSGPPLAIQNCCFRI